MLGQEKTGSYVAGIKQTRKAVRNGTAAGVLLAENADPALTQPLEELCRQRQIPVRWVATMRELGQICRLSVGAAAAAVPGTSNGFNRPPDGALLK